MLLLTACTSHTRTQVTQTPSPTTTATTAPPWSTFVADPCLGVTDQQRVELESEGLHLDDRDRHTSDLGNPCTLSGLKTVPMVQVWFWGGRGLDDLRAEHEKGRLSPTRWQPTEIDGAAAIVYQVEKGPGWCDTAVELDATHYINTRIRYNDGKPTHDTCDQAQKLAAAVLATARADG
ncbi:DUF3558 family protein [Actinokineospora enzanensis]|uniref:DUF3558 family protein n=1 Tax=Actinokineospora enzanensis TaxID=155975 RepID=UPI00146A833D|nr:DUF3558 family protein [Actinokineospora enzanensis]